MGGSLNQPSRVKADGPKVCKLLLFGSKGAGCAAFASTERKSIG